MASACLNSKTDQCFVSMFVESSVEASLNLSYVGFRAPWTGELIYDRNSLGVLFLHETKQLVAMCPSKLLSCKVVVVVIVSLS